MSLDISQSDSQENTANVVFDDDLSIYAIEDLKQQLNILVSTNASLELDLSKVEDFDTSGLQLLMMLKRQIAQTQGQFKINGASEAVEKLLEVYHLTSQLDSKEFK